MKIRTDFVTNSSSSSFCIIGVHFNTHELIDHFRADPEALKRVARFLEPSDDINDTEDPIDASIEQFGYYETFESLIGDLRLIGLFTVPDCEGDFVYLGADLTVLWNEANVTPAEQERRIKAEFAELGFPNVDLRIYEEAYWS